MSKLLAQYLFQDIYYFSRSTKHCIWLRPTELHHTKSTVGLLMSMSCVYKAWLESCVYLASNTVICFTHNNCPDPLVLRCSSPPSTSLASPISTLSQTHKNHPRPSPWRDVCQFHRVKTQELQHIPHALSTHIPRPFIHLPLYFHVRF